VHLFLTVADQIATVPVAGASLALLVTSLLFAIGLIGTAIPMVPGSLIVWAGVLLYRLWLGDAGVGWWFVFVSGGLILLAQIFDLLCTAWGAKKFGATWCGAAGAFAGMAAGAVIGMIFPPWALLWLFLGPVLGAVAGELLGGRKIIPSGQAGFGAVFGLVAAMVMKFALTIFVVGWFYWIVFYRLVTTT
jgi:hypothetical protein